MDKTNNLLSSCFHLKIYMLSEDESTPHIDCQKDLLNILSDSKTIFHYCILDDINAEEDPDNEN